MQSIFDMLYTNFQEDHTNSRRFPGVVDTVNKLDLVCVELNMVAHCILP